MGVRDKMGEGEEGGQGKEVKKIKSYSDVMKMKLDKMMANPDKPVNIPNYHKKEKDINKAPEFNHNIMGSSAGAGSGEFHLYRKMRRKEQEREEVLSHRRHRDDANIAFQEKLKDNETEAEERTAKKRLKRQKEKARKKQLKKQGGQKKDSSDSERTSDEEEGGSTEKKCGDESSEPQKKSKSEPIVVNCTVEV